MKLLIIWVLCIILNILFAAIHSVLTKENSKILHGVWGFIYALICAIPFLIVDFNFKAVELYISLVLLHLSVFPVVYNSFMELPPFNLSKTTTALTDRFMVYIGLKNTAIVNIGAFIVSITLLILSI